MEFLIGRSLANNLSNLGIYDLCRDTLRDLGRRPRRGGGERARRRAGQRRPGPAGGLLPRLAGDARHARLRLRHQLRVRPVPPGDRATASRRRSRTTGWTFGTPWQIERPEEAVPGSRLRPHRARPRPPGQLQPDVARLEGPRRRAPRHADRRLRRPDGQLPAPVLRPVVARLRHADLQRRRLLQGRRAEDRVRDHLQGALSHPTPSPPAASCAWSRSTSWSPAPSATSSGATERDHDELRRVRRQGRHPAQRHASRPGRRRADAHPGRRERPGLGAGLGDHARRRWATPTTR